MTGRTRVIERPCTGMVYRDGQYQACKGTKLSVVYGSSSSGSTKSEEYPVSNLYL